MKNDYSLLAHNTFGIPVKARLFAEYGSVERLKEILETFYRQEKHNPEKRLGANLLHIGGGSNLLFLKDFDGLVLHSQIKGIEIVEETASGVRIRVGAGMVWDELVAETLGRGWYGLENLSLIPGEVGASAVQNIGAYGSEVKDFIKRVYLFDMQELSPLVKSVDEMEYSYRYSVLKSKELRGRYAVTYVEFELSKVFAPRLDYGGLRSALTRNGIALPGECVENSQILDAHVLREVIIKTRKEKLPDPKALGNAGSFFMNPIIDKNTYEKLLSSYPDMPHYEVDSNHVKIPAGWLIEKSGWKGRSLGRAGVYVHQALVLVNLGGAKGVDIAKLCEKVQEDVKLRFGIDIQPEVNFIGL